MTRVAGIDLGATRTRVGVQNADDPIDYREFRTAEFRSVPHLLTWVGETIGRLDRTFIAAAGREEANGKTRLTNVGWVPFHPRHDLPTRACVVCSMLNDVQCAAGAMGVLGPHEYRLLNNVKSNVEDRVAVTVSTGLNSSLYKDGQAHAAETGHTIWQPWEDLVIADLAYQLLRFLQNGKPNEPVTVEDALSGHRGFDNLYNFMRRQLTPSQELVAQVQECRLNHEGIGPTITAAACKGDPFALTCMKLWGGIFGQYLRTITLTNLSRGGTIWLYGGVIEGEGVADLVFQQTPFYTHFIGGRAKMYELMEQISLRVVCSNADIPLTVRGALQLAKEA